MYRLTVKTKNNLIYYYSIYIINNIIKSFTIWQNDVDLRVDVWFYQGLQMLW